MCRRTIFFFGVLLASATAAAQTVADPPVSPITAPQSNPGPDASGVYRIGHGVTSPTVLYKPEPVIPREARKRGINFVVTMSLLVDANGLPQEIRIVRSAAGIYTDKKDRAAALALETSDLESLKHYRFKPAMLNGRPVPVRLYVQQGINPF